MAGDEKGGPRGGGRGVGPAGVLRHHVNPWVLYLGGWLISSLWSGSRKEEVRCVQCGTVFQRSTKASRIAWVLLILVIALILVGLWLELADSHSGAGE